MILCITEKPSVGADIAKILGAEVRRDGYFEGNDYCVTWTFGHLCELKDPADYTPDWRRWSLSALPMIPERFGIKLKDDKGIQHQFEVIERLIKRCDKVINCGDAGQEGELIQRWVMQKAGCDKPVERLWISSLTDESIREGFQHLKPQKELESLYIAGLCRAIGDWILGINATRLYTLKYAQRQDGYGQNNNVLSVGRVQTPTLALVVNRQKEIENFVPTTTYELRTLYRDVTFTSNVKAFKTEEEGQGKLKEAAESEFEVTEVTKKKVKEAPPRLFDLTSLQVEANKKYGLSADETLKTIQALYEKKLTTYPRVDTTYLTDDVYPKCGSILNGLGYYQEVLKPIRGKKLLKSKKVFDNSKVTDHHAIIPTGMPAQMLSKPEWQVYDLVARRFISVFFPDCVFDQTQIKGKAGKIEFKASGKRIAEPGWKSVYDWNNGGDKQAKDDVSDDAKDQEKSLPEFVKGEKGPHKPFLGKKTTTPPSYYTEGTLLKAMETAGASVDDEELREALKANGIGRPSTRAAIIEILYKRAYIRKQGKSLRATDAGIELIGLIKEELLKSAKLTGIWEGRLRAIERGDYSAAEFIAQQKGMINEITLSVLRDPSNRRITQVVETAKPKKKASSKSSTSKTDK
ncbi:MAG: DNA topoisomerase 3 [Muribaculaceae bacterium]|nr:DNA topoisomerase 3 [Muribaculaceae bacterium]MDE6523025.1 DNA topoisomerase 3 [Muribaculaceae bacterium]